MLILSLRVSRRIPYCHLWCAASNHFTFNTEMFHAPYRIVDKTCASYYGFIAILLNILIWEILCSPHPTPMKTKYGMQSLHFYAKFHLDQYIHCLKKVYHPTTNDKFNSSCSIPVIFGTHLLRKYAIKRWFIFHLTCLVFIPYLGKL